MADEKAAALECDRGGKASFDGDDAPERKRARLPRPPVAKGSVGRSLEELAIEGLIGRACDVDYHRTCISVARARIAENNAKIAELNAQNGSAADTIEVHEGIIQHLKEGMKQDAKIVSTSSSSASPIVPVEVN